MDASGNVENSLTPLPPSPPATKAHTPLKDMQNAVPQTSTKEQDLTPDHGQWTNRNTSFWLHFLILVTQLPRNSTTVSCGEWQLYSCHCVRWLPPTGQRCPRKRYALCVFIDACDRHCGDVIITSACCFYNLRFCVLCICLILHCTFHKWIGC